MVHSNAEIHTKVFRLCSLTLLQGLIMLCLFHLFAKPQLEQNQPLKSSHPREIISMELNDFPTREKGDILAALKATVRNHKDITMINSDYLSKEDSFAKLMASAGALEDETAIPDDNPFLDLMKLTVEGPAGALSSLAASLKSKSIVSDLNAIRLPTKQNDTPASVVYQSVPKSLIMATCLLFVLLTILLSRFETSSLLNQSRSHLDSLRKYGASINSLRKLAFNHSLTNPFVVWIGGLALFLLLIHLFHTGIRSLMTDISAQELFLVLIIPLVVYWLTQLIMKKNLFDKIYSA